MHDLALLLAAAAAAMALARLLRAPPIPLLLACGVGLAWVAEPSREVVDNVLALGVFFLVFAMGLELDPRRVRVQRRAVVRVGILQFLVLAGLGFAAARLLGLGGGEAAFVALVLPASSTLVAVRLLQRRRQMYEPFGRLVLGVLLLQDILVILLIPVVLGWGEGLLSVVDGTARVLALGAVALAVRGWVAPRLLALAAEREAVLLVVLSILFLFLGGAILLELPVVVGGFLAGVSLARFPVNGLVRGEVAPLRDFFAALFFTALGVVVRPPSPEEVVQVAVLTGIILFVTPPLVAWIAERSGFTSRSALEAGLLLSQTSEISLAVGLTALLQGGISESLFVVLALVALITMLLTPLISTDQATRFLLRFRPRRRVPEADPPRGHVLVLGAGSTGMPLLEDLILEGRGVAVVDDDPGLVASLQASGIHAVRGEATDLATLRAAGLEHARVVCSTARRVRDNETLLLEARGIPVLVRVFEEADAAWVRARGGEPLLYTEAAAEDLLEWFGEGE